MKIFHIAPRFLSDHILVSQYKTLCSLSKDMMMGDYSNLLARKYENYGGFIWMMAELCNLEMLRRGICNCDDEVRRLSGSIDYPVSIKEIIGDISILTEILREYEEFDPSVMEYTELLSLTDPEQLQLELQWLIQIFWERERQEER